MQDIQDAYANPDYGENSGPNPSSPNPRRKVETDFYTRWTPKNRYQGKTYGETMQEISGGKMSEIVCKAKGVMVTGVPDVKAPEACALYLKKLLDARGCYGPYEVHNVVRFGPYTNVNFEMGCDSMCPIHMETHPDKYGFTYKIKKGQYGGWKCWKDDSWETQYVWESIDLFE